MYIQDLKDKVGRIATFAGFFLGLLLFVILLPVVWERIRSQAITISPGDWKRVSRIISTKRFAYDNALAASTTEIYTLVTPFLFQDPECHLPGFSFRVENSEVHPGWVKYELLIEATKNVKPGTYELKMYLLDLSDPTLDKTWGDRIKIQVQ